MTGAVRLFGIDLAWSDRHATGGCVIDVEGRLVDERLLGDDDAIISWIARHLEGPAVVAIDGPLHVPNSTGRRPAESEITAVYGGRKAGAHSSNRSLFLDRFGRVRGEDLARRLAPLGFDDPWSAGDRNLLEVYPHPALIETFALPERLRYKAKRGMRVPDRRDGLRRLSSLLDSLRTADPPLAVEAMPVPDTLRGRRLKDVEDLLDARLCAWIAGVWWRYGEGRVRLFGDRTTGHIAVPQARAR